MISKENFVDIMNKLKEDNEIHSKISDLTQGCFYSILDTVVIDLLNQNMNLTDEFNTVEWWVYELDFGEKYTKDSLTIDGKVIDVSDAGKLYDYLLEYEVKDDE